MMSSLVLSQPMFLPWRGMFEQIKLSDLFIYYDDVQLPKGGGKGRGFQTRVQIKTSDGVRWLSVPIQRTDSKYILIKDALFSDQKWRQKHLATIRNSYKDAPYFEKIYDGLLRDIYDYQTDFLSEFCVNSINRLMDYIGIKRKTYLSSELGIAVNEGASERVLAHCQHFGADEYISGHGAKNYIDHSMFEEANIKIMYMDYSLSKYPQINGEFTPYVSIIDLLLNVDIQAYSYLDSTSKYWKLLPDAIEGRKSPK